MESFDQYKMWITNEIHRHSEQIEKISTTVSDIKSDIKVLQTKMLLATSIAATVVSITVGVVGKIIGG